MRSAGVLLVLAGCGFHSSAASSTPPIDDAAQDTSSVPLDAGQALDAMQPAFCAIDNLVACYEFEGNAQDGSRSKLNATTTNVSFVSDGQVGMAMQVNPTSTATVPPSILVNLDIVTIEVWVKPTQLPASTMRFDVFDADQQYALIINDNGTVACDLYNVANFSTAAPIPVDQWTHLACTYDGTTVAYIYINGSVAATNNGSGTLAKGGHAMGIAQNFPSGQQLIGLIDQLRLLNVARSAAEICADAGKTSCP